MKQGKGDTENKTALLKAGGNMKNKIQLIIGTSNPHKVHEMNEIVKGSNVEFLPLSSNNFNPNESGETFEENAAIKAVEAARVSLSGEYFLADDSGLCTDFLNGAPGIRSSRYAKTSEDRINKLLAALGGTKNRGAHFVCALCLVDKNGKILHTEKGEVYGEITLKPSGTNGFGYDPVFLVNGLNKTMAQLTEEEKNTLSHRGQALKQMVKWVINNL